MVSVANAVRHVSKKFLNHPHLLYHKPTNYLKNKKSDGYHEAIKSSLLLIALDITFKTTCLELKRARRALVGSQLALPSPASPQRDMKGEASHMS